MKTLLGCWLFISIVGVGVSIADHAARCPNEDPPSPQEVVFMTLATPAAMIALIDGYHPPQKECKS